MKTLTEQEIGQIRDLVCSAILTKDIDNKQYYLIEIGGIITKGGKKAFINSGESQGYTIDKGINPHNQ